MLARTEPNADWQFGDLLPFKYDALTDAAVRTGATMVKVEGVQFVIKGGRVVTTLEGGMATTPRYDKQRLNDRRPV